MTQMVSCRKTRLAVNISQSNYVVCRGCLTTAYGRVQHAQAAAGLTALCLGLCSALLGPCTVGALDDTCAGLQGGLGQPAAAAGNNNLGLVATSCKGTRQSHRKTTDKRYRVDRQP